MVSCMENWETDVDARFLVRIPLEIEQFISRVKSNAPGTTKEKETHFPANR